MKRTVSSRFSTTSVFVLLMFSRTANGQGLLGGFLDFINSQSSGTPTGPGDSAAFPPDATDPFPPDSADPFPPDVFPPDDTGVFPPDTNGPFPPDNSGVFPPDNNNGPFPPDNSGVFSPDNNNGPFPPDNSGVFPPDNNSGPFPPDTNNGPFPPDNIDVFPPDNLGPFPPDNISGPSPIDNSGIPHTDPRPFPVDAFLPNAGLPSLDPNDIPIGVSDPFIADNTGMSPSNSMPFPGGAFIQDNLGPQDGGVHNTAAGNNNEAAIKSDTKVLQDSGIALPDPGGIDISQAGGIFNNAGQGNGIPFNPIGLNNIDTVPVEGGVFQPIDQMGALPHFPVESNALGPKAESPQGPNIGTVAIKATVIKSPEGKGKPTIGIKPIDKQQTLPKAMPNQNIGQASNLGIENKPMVGGMQMTDNIIPAGQNIIGSASDFGVPIGQTNTNPQGNFGMPVGPIIPNSQGGFGIPVDQGNPNTIGNIGMPIDQGNPNAPGNIGMPFGQGNPMDFGMPLGEAISGGQGQGQDQGGFGVPLGQANTDSQLLNPDRAQSFLNSLAGQFTSGLSRPAKPQPVDLPNTWTQLYPNGRRPAKVLEAATAEMAMNVDPPLTDSTQQMADISNQSFGKNRGLYRRLREERIRNRKLKRNRVKGPGFDDPNNPNRRGSRQNNRNMQGQRQNNPNMRGPRQNNRNMRGSRQNNRNVRGSRQIASGNERGVSIAMRQIGSGGQHRRHKRQLRCNPRLARRGFCTMGGQGGQLQPQGGVVGRRGMRRRFQGNQQGPLQDAGGRRQRGGFRQKMRQLRQQMQGSPPMSIAGSVMTALTAIQDNIGMSQPGKMINKRGRQNDGLALDVMPGPVPLNKAMPLTEPVVMGIPMDGGMGIPMDGGFKQGKMKMGRGRKNDGFAMDVVPGPMPLKPTMPLTESDAMGIPMDGGIASTDVGFKQGKMKMGRGRKNDGFAMDVLPGLMPLNQAMPLTETDAMGIPMDGGMGIPMGGGIADGGFKQGKMKMGRGRKNRKEKRKERRERKREGRRGGGGGLRQGGKMVKDHRMVDVVLDGSPAVESAPAIPPANAEMVVLSAGAQAQPVHKDNMETIPGLGTIVWDANY